MAPFVDLLARTDAYVKKRDGIDKLLKLLRFTAALAVLGGGEGRQGQGALLGVELVARLARLDSTLATTRKGLRLGKFLGNAVSLRDALHTLAHGSPEEVKTALLVAATEAAEGTYYFVEQLLFFTKAGVLDKPLEKKLKPLATTAELISYMGHITLKLRKLRKLRGDSQWARLELQRVDDGALEHTEPASRLVKRPDEYRAALCELAAKQQLVRIGVVQDALDAALAVGDLRGEGSLLARPVVVCVLSLASACLGVAAKW